MCLFIASLNTGSNGNCFYVGNNNEAVLIDAGISRRETEKRMMRLGLSMQKVKAIFVTHEHTDHTCGLESLSAKHNLPVYATAATFNNGSLTVKEELKRYFASYQHVQIGALTIKAFPKQHDACDPHSFIVQDVENVCVGIFTDIGKACEQVIYHFKQCNAVFLEANYDDEMLAKGSYPYFLKRRISGENGHLSNAAALELFCTHKSERLSHLILSHLSKNNNTPELVEKVFIQHASKTKIVVASRYHETELYCIQQAQSSSVKEKIYYVQSAVQLRMF